VDYQHIERIQQEISDYLRLVQHCESLPPFSADRRADLKELNTLARQLNSVMHSLKPDFPLIPTGKSLRVHQDSADIALKASQLLGQCKIMLGESGHVGEPVMPLGLLHSVVEAASYHHWSAGKYRSAVGDAAAAVNVFAQKRLGRHDISDKSLMTEAFTDKPPEPGKPRLRCPGDPTSPTVRSMQEGALHFAMGCYLAFRNPAAHGTRDWNPVTAFQQLAAFSIVAGWIDDWTVEYAPLPPPTLTPEQAQALSTLAVRMGTMGTAAKPSAPGVAGSS
jgi:uncharacterized protein (TIGR02391 family)